jgi:hypothetical protein
MFTKPVVPGLRFASQEACIRELYFHMTLKELSPWIVKLLVGSIWLALKRLPIHLLGALAACLGIGGFVWWVSWRAPSDSALGIAAGTGMAVCYFAAAVLWGLHRALREGTVHALGMYETESPKVLDAILDPVIARLPAGEAKVSITDVKGSIDEYTRQPLGIQPGSRWFAAVSRLAGRLARWTLCKQLALVEKILTALEDRGETELSPLSLKNYLRDQVVNISLGAARRRVLLVDYSVAAAVFLLLTFPPGLAWLSM